MFKEKQSVSERNANALFSELFSQEITLFFSSPPSPSLFLMPRVRAERSAGRVRENNSGLREMDVPVNR
jgi:hypothetical protein